jgi:amino acid efflux transporter
VRPLSTAGGAALYIGALLGPGLLLLPGLAARTAGPASILAWAGLLGLSALLAVVFTALGTRLPSVSGVAGYTAAGLGRRAGSAVGWCFLAGVVAGAPVVCLVGASYVTTLTGGGRMVRAGIAAVLLLLVLALALGGIRAGVVVQLGLVAVLVVVIAVAVGGSASHARAQSWTPFAPHGLGAVGSAAATLMLSFVGWEAVAPLTARFADPRRQLPRVIGIAFAVTALIYLGLAAATVSVLGTRAGTDVPLAALLAIAIGPAGHAVAAVAAVVLTLGSTNAYLSGAAAMAAELPTRRTRSGRSTGSGPRALLVTIALIGLAMIALYAVGLIGTAQLVAIPTTLFVSVYVGCTVSAVRVLTGAARMAAIPSAAAVLAVLVFCGWAIVIAVAVAALGAVLAPGDCRLRAVVRPLKLRDVELAHLEHGLHGPAGLVAVRVTEQFAEHGRDDLPGQAVAVLEPTALAGLTAAREELLPVVVDLLLGLHADEQRDRLGEGELRAAVEHHELAAGQLEGAGEYRARRHGTAFAVP